MDDMKAVKALISGATSDVAIQRPTKHEERVYTKQEADTVGYFYARLRSVYPDHFARSLPDADAVRNSKREFASMIAHYDRDQIDAGMDFVKNMQANFEEGWEFMAIGRCIGAIREANRNRSAHKALPAPTGRSVSKDEALSLFASLRDDVGLEKAVEPVIKTMSEADLLAAVVKVKR